MIVTINHRTQYSKSPVIILSKSNGVGYQPDTIKVAITKAGEIYRLLKYREEPEECRPFEMEISEKTVALLDNWEKYRKYSSGYDLQKLHTVQEYELQLACNRLHDCPIHSLDIKMYYPAAKALEMAGKYEAANKEIFEKFKEIRSLKNQLRIVQAKLKVPAIMAATGCNERQGLAYALAGKRFEYELRQLFDKKIIHPNGYSGRGKFTSKGSDKAATISTILTDAGIKHTTGNDAPKGGFSGDFIKLK